MAESVFFLGGVRSGKSAAALTWACSFTTDTRLFFAPCRAQDAEMRARVARHRAERGTLWQTIEEPLAIGERMAEICAAYASTRSSAVLLLDCLSAWVANCLESGLSPQSVCEGAHTIARLVQRAPIPIGIVSVEVGLGLVPMQALARRFTDVLGDCNQIIAAACATVLFYAAGLPLVLKGTHPKP